MDLTVGHYAQGYTGINLVISDTNIFSLELKNKKEQQVNPVAIAFIIPCLYQLFLAEFY